ASSVLSGLVVLVLSTVLAQTASAHHVNLIASASCSKGAPVISYTVSTWDPVTIAGTDSLVTVTFNGNLVESNSFTLAQTNFSNPKAAPGGVACVIVEASAVNDWGDGAAGGQNAVVTVDLPADCVQATGGRFTGGGKQIDLVGGVTLTKGFTIHCDLILSNN